jgi:hypothetical protein
LKVKSSWSSRQNSSVERPQQIKQERLFLADGPRPYRRTDDGLELLNHAKTGHQLSLGDLDNTPPSAWPARQHQDHDKAFGDQVQTRSRQEKWQRIVSAIVSF